MPKKQNDYVIRAFQVDRLLWRRFRVFAVTNDVTASALLRRFIEHGMEMVEAGKLKV